MRKLAEARLPERTQDNTLTHERALHELDVYRVELEMQNEELREAQRNLEMALASYTQLFDFAPIGYAATSEDGTIREINHAAAQLLARRRKRLVGMRFANYVALADQDKLEQTIQRALATRQPATCELVLYQPGRVELAARVTVGPLMSPRPILMLAFEDISQQKAAEQALRETDRRKDEFLATLSHELRNPLAPIRTGVSVLEQAPPGSELASKTLAIIERQVAHMTRLFDDLLDVTRITRGKFELQRERVELGELVRRIAEDHAAGFAAARVALRREITTEPLWLDADPARLVQVATNLLTNAQKFTPPGGTVTIGLARDRLCAVLRVRDSGVGIPRDMLEHVCEPFAQAPQTLDRSRGGLGLGLAMVKGILDLHGGTIAIASEGPGAGTEVTVTLPLDASPVRAAEAAAVSAPKRVRRVLVIEDSVDIADTLKSAIELEGHQVDVAYDGPQGLERARAFHPDVVVCDLGLPGMDGLDVARAMRADRELHDVFLVALSGYARPEDRARTAAAGFDLHIAKPPDLATLRHALEDEPSGHRA